MPLVLIRATEIVARQRTQATQPAGALPGLNDKSCHSERGEAILISAAAISQDTETASSQGDLIHYSDISENVILTPKSILVISYFFNWQAKGKVCFPRKGRNYG